MTMKAKRQRGYEVVAFPWMRVPIVDSLRAARRSPRMYALVEADVEADLEAALAAVGED